MEDIKNLPVYVNLGDVHNWKSHIGFADISTREGLTEIVIRLDEKTSSEFGHMAKIFELKAVGFAGIKKR